MGKTNAVSGAWYGFFHALKIRKDFLVDQNPSC
jgi:hypothetical protein